MATRRLSVDVLIGSLCVGAAAWRTGGDVVLRPRVVGGLCVASLGAPWRCGWRGLRGGLLAAPWWLQSTYHFCLLRWLQLGGEQRPSTRGAEVSTRQRAGYMEV